MYWIPSINSINQQKNIQMQYFSNPYESYIIHTRRRTQREYINFYHDKNKNKLYQS